MSYQPKPTVNGVYRIKVLNQNLYLECDSGYNPRPGVKLSPPSSSSTQEWDLIQVPGQPDCWTIINTYDQSGLTYFKSADTYWGHGYPLPENGPSSTHWHIVKEYSGGQSFSKIKLAGGSDCFDSCDPGSDWVHFYYEHRQPSDGPKQCYVFEQC
ncbi:hypothetical protein FRC07_014958 [Ceratobasidium sp. 392]|nr:hypothetical protein FRC07_014958 [Ceratobasidium sp. 392]